MNNRSDADISFNQVSAAPKGDSRQKKDDCLVKGVGVDIVGSEVTRKQRLHNSGRLRPSSRNIY
jgi:hypothetical protein